MPRKPTPTLKDAVDAYLRSRHHLKDTTLVNDRSALHRFARGLGEDRLIGNITPVQVERWFLEVCAQTNKRESSYNKVRSKVGLFLHYCGRHGWVKVDLLQDVGRRTVPRIERLRLDGYRMLELLDVTLDPCGRCLIACSMNTGLRAGEITGIRIANVDLGKGEIYFYRTKTSSDDRLPITKRLDVELRRWLAIYAAELGDVPLSGDMLLFPARTPPRLRGGNEPGQARIMTLGKLQPYKVKTHPERIIQKALRTIGVDVTFQEGLHTLRRSAARALFEHITTRASEPGYDSAPRTTASWLGHKNTATTELYLGLSGDRRKRDLILRGNDFLPPDPVGAVVHLRAVR